MTKIFHPNVASNGEICVNTLKKDWKADLGIKQVLLVSKVWSEYINIPLLAHLSRRLIGELIGYSWSGVRLSSVRRSQCSKIFFSETAGPIKAKFYVEPSWVGGTIFCSRHLGHMTKMAATPIYGKNPSKIFFSRTGGSIFTKLGM